MYYMYAATVNVYEANDGTMKDNKKNSKWLRKIKANNTHISGSGITQSV
jgi:hypothetical protein